MKGTYHEVRDGEDLVSLAEWYYGASEAWTHLYYANLDIYGDDFERIPAGAMVFIPDIEKAALRFLTKPVVTYEYWFPFAYGAVEGAFKIGIDADGNKYLVLKFLGEGQAAT